MPKISDVVRSRVNERIQEKETKRVKEINRLHSEIDGLTEKIDDLRRTSLDKAIKAGRLLKARPERKSRKWEAWVKDNLEFTVQTARNYIRVFENCELLKTKRVFDLTEAYEFLKEPKKSSTARKSKKEGESSTSEEEQQGPDDPPKETVPFTLTKDEDDDFGRLVRNLMETVFETESVKATVFAALRFAEKEFNCA